MADDIILDGSIDSAADAIKALLGAPETADETPEQDDTPQQDAAPQQAAASPDEQNTGEEAPQGDMPADQPQGDNPQPQAQAPQPVIMQPAPQVAPQATAPSTVQTQLSQLNQAIPVIQAQIASAFPDVQSPDDLIRLAQTDPGRAVAYQAAQAKLNSIAQARDHAQAAYRSEWTATEAAKLQKAIPDIADPQKGPELQSKLRAYAKECGYTDQQIEWAAASDVTLLYQAMQFRDGQQNAAAKAKADAEALAVAKAKAAKAPPVQQPGTQRTTGKEDKAREGFERLQKSGRVDDAAAVFRSILG